MKWKRLIHFVYLGIVSNDQRMRETRNEQQQDSFASVVISHSGSDRRVVSWPYRHRSDRERTGYKAKMTSLDSESKSNDTGPRAPYELTYDSRQ